MPPRENTQEPPADLPATPKRRRGHGDSGAEDEAPPAKEPRKSPDRDGRSSSRTPAEPAPPAKKRGRVPLNARPARELHVFGFGDGFHGELGLGNLPHEGKMPITVKRPRLNHNLLPGRVGVVQVACGGMHAVALTNDNRILTWGANDDKALGRVPDSAVSGSKSEFRRLDPGESTPGDVDLSHLPRTPVFVQVAATEAASFALTEDGAVYGWGTFRVCERR